MELTNDEKEIIINALDKHLEEVRRVQKLGDKTVQAIEAEEKYIQTVEALKKKVKG